MAVQMEEFFSFFLTNDAHQKSIKLTLYLMGFSKIEIIQNMIN